MEVSESHRGDGGNGGGVPRWVPLLVGIAAAGGLLYALHGVLTPVFFAFIIAYMLDPVVDRFERLGFPRALGIVIVLTIVLGALGLFVLLVVPGVVRDMAAVVPELVRSARGLLAKAEPWLHTRGVTVPHTFDEALADLPMGAQDLAGKAIAPAGTVLGWIAGGTASVLGAAASLLTVPVFAFYLLYDFDRMTAAAAELTPWRVRSLVSEVAGEVDDVLGQFVRGQFLVMVILAVLYAVAYTIAGVRLAVPIAIVAGLLSFIPYVGGATAVGLAVLMSLVDWGGWGQIRGRPRRLRGHPSARRLRHHPQDRR